MANIENPRVAVLTTATDLVTGDRNNDYGPPTQDFARTAALLNALGYRRQTGYTREINAEGDRLQDDEPLYGELRGSDVAQMMRMVKESRVTWSPLKADNYIDGAGYWACGFECALEENLE